jgi:hypothetical protein
MGRYLIAWFPMIVIAVANGALREAWLVPRLDDPAARQVSTLLLTIASGAQAVGIGALWLVLTLVFEFALGRFVSGLAWREMLAEYDLAAGRLWGTGADLGGGSAVPLLPPVARRLSAILGGCTSYYKWPIAYHGFL